MSQIFFISHPEVVIDPTQPVTSWRLSEAGEERVHTFGELPLCSEVRSVYASTELKAVRAAELLAQRWQLPLQLLAELGEHDRSSTGYLTSDAFEAAVDAFFAKPDVSYRGWETALNAQARIVSALQAISDEAPAGDIAVISHGGVGTLSKCWLKRIPISRGEDQPYQGHFYLFGRESRLFIQDWTPLPTAGFRLQG